jgi:hypothetical protein
MTAATLLAEIEQADGKIWMDGDRLKFRAVPARLVPFIRAQKPELIALLSTPAPAPDDYATAERLAIQSEDSLPPDRGFDAPKRRAITSTDLVRAYQANPRTSKAIALRLSDLQNAHEPYDFIDLGRIIAEENARLMYPPPQAPAPAKSTADAAITPTMQHSADMAPHRRPEYRGAQS